MKEQQSQLKFWNVRLKNLDKLKDKYKYYMKNQVKQKIKRVISDEEKNYDLIKLKNTGTEDKKKEEPLPLNRLKCSK